MQVFVKTSNYVICFQHQLKTGFLTLRQILHKYESISLRFPIRRALHVAKAPQKINNPEQDESRLSQFRLLMPAYRPAYTNAQTVNIA